MKWSTKVSTNLRVKRKLIDAIIFTFSPHKKKKRTELKRFPSLPRSSFVSRVVSGCDDSGAVMTIIGKKKKKHQPRNYKLRKRSPMRKFSPPPVRWLRVMRRLGDGEVILLMAEPL